MRHEVISFAEALFPEADTLTALEMLLLLVYATMDDIIFAAEDNEEYPIPDSPPEDDIVWDYVY